MVKRLGKGNYKRTSIEQERMVVDSLFPRHDPLPMTETVPAGEIPLLSMDELLEAMTKMKLKKAPGHDEVTPETWRLVVEAIPETILKMYNELLAEGSFPKTWKMSRLVLACKPGKTGQLPSDFRPICLIDE